MRLFIAINLNDEIKNTLMAAILELKKGASKGNFTHRENLHLTLVFLGELSEDRIVDIRSAMNQIKEKPFGLSLSGFGQFKRKSGDIHWVGIDQNPALLSLQKKLTTELQKVGFSLENREYSPHLTLGREVRLADPSVNIYNALPLSKEEMTVSRISLMKSERIEGKLAYSEIYGRDLI